MSSFCPDFLYLKFSNKGLGRRHKFHELPERDWGKGRGSLHSCCVPRTWEKIIKTFKCKGNCQSQAQMEKGPSGQPNLDKAWDCKHGILVSGKGFSCCCSLFAGESFGSWMLHSSSFPSQPSSRLFSLFFYSVEEIRHHSKKRWAWVSAVIQLCLDDCQAQPVVWTWSGLACHLQNEKSALDEWWRPFFRFLLWSCLPGKVYVMCVHVVSVCLAATEF